MSKHTTTLYSKKCEILADIWTTYRGEKEFASFISYNDLGLPLAYAISNNIIESSNSAETFINEAFDLLLDLLSIENDPGFETLDEIFDLTQVE